MANLPLIQSDNKDLMKVETRWKSQLDPVVGNPILGGHQINSIKIVTGVNQINHGLGRKLQGYIPVLNDSAVTFHDNQSTNAMPDLTLLLVSTGPATISLWVY